MLQIYPLIHEFISGSGLIKTKFTVTTKNLLEAGENVDVSLDSITESNRYTVSVNGDANLRLLKFKTTAREFVIDVVKSTVDANKSTPEITYKVEDTNTPSKFVVGETQVQVLPTRRTVRYHSNGVTVQYSAVDGVSFPETENAMVALLDTTEYLVVPRGNDISTLREIVNANLSHTNKIVTSLHTSLSRLFADAASFNGDISSWDVSNVNTIRETFLRAASFNKNLDKWNVTNVEDMFGVFQGATAFNGDISTWNISRVKNLGRAFQGATSFNGDLSLWKPYRVMYLMSTFQDATAFTSEINSWQMPFLSKMERAFANATSFNQDLFNWDVSNVTDLTETFKGATSFNKNISSWNVSNVKNFTNTFNGATAFNTDISSWNVSNVTQMDGTFQDATSFDINIGKWNVSHVTTMNNIFNGATAFSHDLSTEWNVYNVNSHSDFRTGNTKTTFKEPLWNSGVLFRGYLVELSPDQKKITVELTKKPIENPIISFDLTAPSTMLNVTLTPVSSFLPRFVYTGVITPPTNYTTGSLIIVKLSTRASDTELFLSKEIHRYAYQTNTPPTSTPHTSSAIIDYFNGGTIDLDEKVQTYGKNITSLNYIDYNGISSSLITHDPETFKVPLVGGSIEPNDYTLVYTVTTDAGTSKNIYYPFTVTTSGRSSDYEFSKNNPVILRPYVLKQSFDYLTEKTFIPTFGNLFLKGYSLTDLTIQENPMKSYIEVIRTPQLDGSVKVKSGLPAGTHVFDYTVTTGAGISNVSYFTVTVLGTPTILKSYTYPKSIAYNTKFTFNPIKDNVDLKGASITSFNITNFGEVPSTLVSYSPTSNILTISPGVPDGIHSLEYHITTAGGKSNTQSLNFVILPRDDQSFLEKNLKYILIGIAVIFGILVLMSF